jgi:hypothetical protein
MVSAVIITTDFACALLPLVFIHKINRPMREKAVLAGLMALGLLASVCGIVKVVGLNKVLDSKDPIFDGADLLVWS